MNVCIIKSMSSCISVSSKHAVDNLLQQINKLPDIDKFLLYLKLPVGKAPELDPLKQ